MIEDLNILFTKLLKAEVKKIDFKRDQYSLSNEHLKSEFVKDILCIANASGEDGYILLGIKSEKGKPKEITGISHHHDGSDLEQLVNSTIEPPIHFEYYPHHYKMAECALIHIPSSSSRPHWPKKDFGVLKKHVFYTRRGPGNREASMAEIRDMLLDTVTIRQHALHKRNLSPHIVDELGDLDLLERQGKMYAMLKNVSKQISFVEHYIIRYKKSSWDSGRQQIAAFIHTTDKAIINDYIVVMYPFTVKHLRLWQGRHLIDNRNSYIQYPKDGKEKILNSSIIHIAYKTIYTKSLETRAYSSSGGYFANEWEEPWGKVIKWEEKHIGAKYEFFLSNVSSQAELKERLEQLFTWVAKNNLQPTKKLEG
jgi:hypothetical protein